MWKKKDAEGIQREQQRLESIRGENAMIYEEILKVALEAGMRELAQGIEVPAIDLLVD